MHAQGGAAVKRDDGGAKPEEHRLHISEGLCLNAQGKHLPIIPFKCALSSLGFSAGPTPGSMFAAQGPPRSGDGGGTGWAEERQAGVDRRFRPSESPAQGPEDRPGVGHVSPFSRL